MLAVLDTGSLLAVEHDDARSPIGRSVSWGPMTVFVYVNTGKQVGDPEHLKVFAIIRMPQKLGSRRTTPRAWPLSMRSWSDAEGGSDAHSGLGDRRVY